MSVTISVSQGYFGKNKANFTRVDLNTMTIWFSYKTAIGFMYKGEKVVRENDWSTTTGKHLNYIEPDHKARISGQLFEKKLNEALGVVG